MNEWIGLSRSAGFKIEEGRIRVPLGEREQLVSLDEQPATSRPPSTSLPGRGPARATSSASAPVAEIGAIRRLPYFGATVTEGQASKLLASPSFPPGPLLRNPSPRQR